MVSTSMQTAAILRAVAEAICQEAVAKRQYGQAKIVQVPMKI